MGVYSLAGDVDKDKVFLVKRSELIGRIDSTAYKQRFQFTSRAFKLEKIAKVAYINPPVSFSQLDCEDEISFVPMEIVNEKNGTIEEIRTKKVGESKGFTRFAENDLIWAKITPCMQNGKSAVARNLKQGYACGSTEFFVIRPKYTDELLVDYIHFLLRDKRVLKDAQNYFGGTAGQQRVSSDFLKEFKIPIPPIEIQEKIVANISSAYKLKQQKETEAKRLLESIDSYLLEELGITLPEEDKSLGKRVFTTRFSEVMGGRFDPNYFSLEFAILDDFFNKYNLTTLDRLSIQISDAPHERPEFSEKEEVRVIMIEHLKSEGIQQTNEKYITSNYHLKLKSTILQKDDLLMARIGVTTGITSKVDDFFIGNNISGNITLIRLNHSKINVDFVLEYLNSYLGRLYIRRNLSNSARDFLTVGKIKSIPIPVIEFEKQNKIAEYIKSLRDKAKTLQQEAVRVLEEAKGEVERMIIGE